MTLTGKDHDEPQPRRVRWDQAWTSIGLGGQNNQHVKSALRQRRERSPSPPVGTRRFGAKRKNTSTGLADGKTKFPRPCAALGASSYNARLAFTLSRYSPTIH